MAEDGMKLHSQEIGAKHESRVGQLLDAWGVRYQGKRKLKTAMGGVIEVDLWVPAAEGRPTVAIECKEFGVAAKSVADSRRRKAQEALWSLVQLRRHCTEGRSVRILVVTGKEKFLPEQIAVLQAELGPDFGVVSVEAQEEFQIS
jgi:hypothetical protein